MRFANNFDAKYAFESFDQFVLRKMQWFPYAGPWMKGIKALSIKFLELSQMVQFYNDIYQFTDFKN